MSKTLPRLVKARRRELHEKKQQLSGLVGLREQLGKQMRYIESMSGPVPSGPQGGAGSLTGDINNRRECLNASITQVDLQITAARSEIEEHVRALRLLEANRGAPPRSSNRSIGNLHVDASGT